MSNDYEQNNGGNYYDENNFGGYSGGNYSNGLNGQTQFQTQRQGYQGQIYQTQINNMQPPNNKVKRKKKKKKHRFLKFILFCLIIYLGYKGSYKLLSYLAENEMSKFVTDYPFTFEEPSDSLWYVTNNFNVPTCYKLNDKEYNVEWSTSSKSITIDNSGNATVNRPNDISIVVNVVETYKKLWGEATREYELTLIPTSIISESDIDIIDLESIKNGEYSRKMQAVSDTSGNLKYMLGDFKDTYVNSSDDALILLQAYKSHFTNNDISFKFIDVINIGMYITYKFDILVDGIKVENDSASIVVNKDTNSVVKISIDTKNISNNTSDNILNTNDILEKMEQQLVSSEFNIGTTNDYVLYYLDKILSDSKVIYVANIMTQDGESLELKLDASTGDIISYKSLMSDADEEGIKASSIDEKGNDIEFSATFVKPGWLGFLEKEKYILKDQNRNIHSYNNEGWWGLFKAAEKEAAKKDPNFFEQVGGVFVMLGGLGDYYIENLFKTEIVSETDYFEDSVAAQVHYNMEKVYDWYKDTLGIISFDGKGKEIVIRNHVKFTTDNAAWDTQTKTFVVNPSKVLKYSVGLHLEVIGHEYTHAVFQYAGAGLNGGGEVAGLSEAYGDIMGTVISQNDDWIICDTQLADGTHKIMRDLKDINGTNMLQDLKYPETYHGENWTGEEHNICVIIGHIAYEMQANGGFSWNDLADIWYNSLGLGYDNSSTFVTCRKYIIQTADDLGYSDEQIDFIANAFDEREIFDESYKFRTDKYENTNKATSDGSKTIKTEENSIDGDPLLDNNKKHRFLFGYSIMQTLFVGDGIYIYEESNNMTKEEQEAFTDRLNKQIASKYDLTSLSGNTITVQYRQLPGWQIDFLDRFCSHTMDTVKGKTYSIIDSEGLSSEDDTEIKGFIDKILKLAFDWEITESTAYDFYTRFGLID